MSKKRERDNDGVLDASPTESPSNATTGHGPGGTSSNFRNVSACNRCRHRKNRCDQQLPRCSACLKAGTKCVGFDPVSKREIPRSYVYYLETRVRNLEAIVSSLGAEVPPPEEDFPIDEKIKPGVNVPFPVLEDEPGTIKKSAKRDAATSKESKSTITQPAESAIDPALKDGDENGKVDKLADNIGTVSVQPGEGSKSLGTQSGISFARVVFAAVRSSVSHAPSERAGAKTSKQASSSTASGGGSNARDSFFGLHSRPTIKPAPFPDKALALRLAGLYFEHANPQIPILHRGEFNALLERVYAKSARDRTSRELYLLNMVFAVGSGIINDSNAISSASHARSQAKGDDDEESPNKKRLKLASQQCPPEEYHSSAIVHLESFLSGTPALGGYAGGLEELQAVLLLAALALLRPVAPGLWYIVGVAVRLSVDLGLHVEEADLEPEPLSVKVENSDNAHKQASKAGRRQWTRDLRRRLWWCVYSYDRLVSTCVGRPFGITDQVITTEFPTLLDDASISTAGFLKPTSEASVPTYKLVSHHYFRLRLLQSEILQVLQYRQAQQARSSGANQNNEYMHKHLPSPFLQNFASYRDWRADVDRRLGDWREQAPTQADTGVAFNPLFLELNYWQALIMLYRQSLAVPEPLAQELSASTGEEIHSPGAMQQELEEDELMVFMKVAQAGQTVLKLYRQLHREKLVNYTYLATHHLFMSGISFLYALWHSPAVRSHLTLDDVDFTILAATSVLTDLMANCPPAEACRDAFTRMAKATITMCMSTTGFGVASSLGTQPLNSPAGYFGSANVAGISIPEAISEKSSPQQPIRREQRSVPRFDMNLRDLFSDDELGQRMQSGRGSLGNAFPQPRLQHQASMQSAPYPQQPTYTNSSPHSNAVRTSTTSPFQQNHHSQFTPMMTSPPPQQPTYATMQGMQPAFASLTENAGFSQQPQADFAFDTTGFGLDFLDAYQAPSTTGNQDNSNAWSTYSGFGASGELDFGFGTGGTAGWEGMATGGGADDTTGWADGGGMDLFDGFFFGNGNANGGGSGVGEGF